METKKYPQIKKIKMWENIKELFSENKNTLFMASFAVILGVIGFLIKHYYFSSGINIAPSTFNSYILLKDYKKDLISKEKEITQKLTTAHNQEKIASLEYELKIIQQTVDKYKEVKKIKMWENIKELFSENKNTLFIVSFTAILGVIGFFIKHYYFSSGINIAPSTPNSHISLEDYKKDLISKEKEITQKLTTAHNQEKIASLEYELKIIQQTVDKYKKEI